MKKEVKKGRNVGKIGGCVAGEGEFENGAGAPGASGKGPKILKNIFLKKSIWDVCLKYLRGEDKERVEYPEEGIRKGGRKRRKKKMISLGKKMRSSLESIERCTQCI